MVTVHSYFTEGYLPWARFFIESFKKSNGEKYKLILSSRNLNDQKINSLKGLYKGIEIKNKNLDYKQLSKKAEISLNHLMKFKNETEINKVNVNNKVWKLMIAAEDRMKEVRDVVKSLNQNDILMHFDIDSYIRKSIDPWIDIVSKNDFTSIFRIKKQIENFGYLKRKHTAICICFQGYTISEKSLKLLDLWIGKIDAVNPAQRPKGFGQTTVYQAYEELKDEFKWGDLPKNDFSLIGVGDHRILWGANKGSKTHNLKAFRQDFKKRMK